MVSSVVFRGNLKRRCKKCSSGLIYQRTCISTRKSMYGRKSMACYFTCFLRLTSSGTYDVHGALTTKCMCS
ncbi:hypothetical protein ACS0TY_034978 [Phlomoides rotata]